MQHGYTISGRTLRLAAGITDDNSFETTNGQNVINSNLTLQSSQSYSQTESHGQIVLAGSISLNRHTLTLRGDGFFDILGSITGIGSVVVDSDFSIGILAAARISGASTWTGGLELAKGLVLVDGSAVDADVSMTEGILGGSGAVGAVTGGRIQPGGILDPVARHGLHSIVDTPARLTTRGLAQSTLDIQLDGGVIGTGYDSLNVNGAVEIQTTTLPSTTTTTLPDAELNLTLGYVPARHQKFLVVNNDATDAVVGNFVGMPEGAHFDIGPYPFTITYVGGTGNDIVLESLSGDPLNAAPLAANDSYELDLGSAAQAGLTDFTRSGLCNSTSTKTLSGILTNDTDPDDDSLGIELFDPISTAKGIVSANATGGFDYESPSDFRGEDSFSYLASDGSGGTSLAYVTIDVHCCGDGIAEGPAEQCDAGTKNGTSSSCCSVTCQLDGTCTTTTTLPAAACGDATGDGEITVADALETLRAAVGSADCPLEFCDYDGSGVITTADALAILRVSVGADVPPQCG